MHGSRKFPGFTHESVIDGVGVLNAVVDSVEMLGKLAHLMLAGFPANFLERMRYLGVVECGKLIEQGLFALLR